jgi:high mobility group protein B2
MVKSKVKNMNELVSEYVKLFLESNSVEEVVVEKWDEEENQKKLEKIIKGQQKKDEKKKVKKQEKKNKHKDEPKKPKSAYICFCTEKRQEVKDTNDGISNTDIMAELGKLWKGLNDSDKSKWEKIANEDKQRYETELRKFYTDHPEEVKEEKSKIKKPVSSYVIYSNLKRAEVKSKNPKLSPKEILSLLGKMWKELSDDDKEEYKELAAEDKARYKRETGVDSGDDKPKEEKKVTKEKKESKPKATEKPKKETKKKETEESDVEEEPVKEEKPKGKGKGKGEKKKVSKA